MGKVGRTPKAFHPETSGCRDKFHHRLHFIGSAGISLIEGEETASPNNRLRRKGGERPRSMSRNAAIYSSISVLGPSCPLSLASGSTVIPNNCCHKRASFCACQPTCGHSVWFCDLFGDASAVADGRRCLIYSLQLCKPIVSVSNDTIQLAMTSQKGSASCMMTSYDIIMASLITG